MRGCLHLVTAGRAARWYFRSVKTKIYLLGARSLAKAEGVSIEQARAAWKEAHEAIIYREEGRVASVLAVAIVALVLSNLAGTFCVGFCEILKHLGRTVAFLLVPSYMAVALSARAKQTLESRGPDQNR